MKTTIKVKKSDIDSGHRRNAKRCPVALAMSRAGFKSPVVGRCWVRWSGNLHPTELLEWTELPECAIKFILAHDYALPSAKPFSFTIDQ